MPPQNHLQLEEKHEELNFDANNRYLDSEFISLSEVL